MFCAKELKVTEKMEAVEFAAKGAVLFLDVDTSLEAKPEALEGMLLKKELAVATSAY